jgi:hypothetical protein
MSRSPMNDHTFLGFLAGFTLSFELTLFPDRSPIGCRVKLSEPITDWMSCELTLFPDRSPIGCRVNSHFFRTDHRLDVV